MNFWFNRLCWSWSMAFFVVVTSIVAHNDDHAVSIFHHAPRIDAPQQQTAIKQQSNWKSFTQKHGQWHVTFNTLTQLPMRAAGKPIALANGKDVVEQAKRFIETELGHLGIPTEQLVFHKINESPKYTYINFIQTHKGKTILYSKLQIRINQNNQVVGFKADVFNDIEVDVNAPLHKSALRQKAIGDLHGDHWQVAWAAETKILPIPTAKGYTFALVQEAQVTSAATEGKAPADYYTIINAHTGDIYYRHNKVWTIEVEHLPITANVIHNPNDSSSPVLLPNMRVLIEEKEYKTDETGILAYDGEFPAEGTLFLEGDFARVFNRQGGQQVPKYPIVIEEAGKDIQLTSNINESELAGFYHTNVIHNYMKQWLPAEFTDLDFPMPVNINLTDDECNAYYDGTSINFFAETGQCYSTVLFGDVVYHEYGHGINDFYYSYLGAPMNNGAMHEGYADVWALSLTQNPILSQGGLQKNPNSFVRRYDQNIKVYPEDISGEVHNDGEIIAGAWWDLGELIGMENMMAIFSESLVAGSDRFTGEEGPLYGDILFDAMFASDDDGDLSNGTPYLDEIFESFGTHGISVLIGLEIIHDDLLTMPADIPVQIPFDVLADFNYKELFDQARVYFRTDKSQDFGHFTTALDFNNGSFIAPIPAQAAGTIIEYYIEILDTLGSLPRTLPAGANSGATPYQVIVGLDVKMEDQLTTGENWQLGALDDDASSGVWQIGSPSPTFSSSGNLIQTDIDHTPTFDNYCAFTGNGNNPSSIGQNDVDDGKTTLFSPIFDLTPFQIPVFSYYRWYVNNAGANPGNDFWVVEITNNGIDWVSVENTNQTDANWREVVVKVSDYIEPTATVQLRFIASDPLLPNADLEFDGGSLVEAAVDDLTLYDLPDVVGLSHPLVHTLPIEVYPNPATDFVMIVGGSNIQHAEITLFNVVGQGIYQQNGVNLSQSNFTIPTNDLAAGIYVLKVRQDGAVYQEKIVIQ